MLSSRARHGDFRKLTLVWGDKEWEELVRVNRKYNADESIGGDSQWYNSLLYNLQTGKFGSRYERVIELPGTWDGCSGGYAVTYEEATARTLHMSFGGRLFVGDVLAWEEHERVGMALGCTPAYW